MLLVACPILKNNVINLVAYFVTCGLMEGNGIFYVAFENNEGKTMDVTPDLKASQSDNWIQANAQFEEEPNRDDDLKVFLGKMFMIWDGNHHLQA